MGNKNLVNEIAEIPPFLRVEGEATLLSIKLQPSASKNEICGVLGTELKIKVTAPPVDSAANEELIEFLAGLLGCSKSSVQLIRGRTSRHKTVAVRNLSLLEIKSRLQKAF